MRPGSCQHGGIFATSSWATCRVRSSSKGTKPTSGSASTGYRMTGHSPSYDVSKLETGWKDSGQLQFIAPRQSPKEAPTTSRHTAWFSSSRGKEVTIQKDPGVRQTLGLLFYQSLIALING